MKIVIVTVIFLVTFGILYYIDKKNTQRERLRIEKMRNSTMYEDLYPFIRRLRRRRLEEVTITATEVVFLTLLPTRRRIIFSFELRKHQELSNNRIHSLCLLLQHDIPVLRDKKRYYLKKSYVHQRNEERSLVYTYTMKTQYKDALSRNPLYNHSKDQ